MYLFSKSTGGFYTPNIHGDRIPEDAVEITDEQYAALLAAQTEGREITSDEEGFPVSKDLVPPTIAELKLIALKFINQACEEAVRIITVDYPVSEVLSWPKQEQEARAYLVTNSSPTPLIDSLALARQVDKENLVQRIIDKADQFAVISGDIIGKRQRLEDQLDALDENATAEDVAAIKWD